MHTLLLFLSSQITLPLLLACISIIHKKLHVDSYPGKVSEESFIIMQRLTYSELHRITNSHGEHPPFSYTACHGTAQLPLLTFLATV